MKHVKVFAVAAAACIGLSACGSTPASETTSSSDCTPIAEVKTIKPGKLTALVAEYPPYVSQEGGKISGVDGLLLERTAKALCLELDAQTTSFSAVIEGLRSGRADISAGDWSLNEERADLFETSDGVYKSAASVISRDGYSSLEDLKDKTIGTPQGYLWVEDFQTALGREKVKLYQSEAAVFDDLAAGRIDAGVVGEGGAAHRLAQGSYGDLQMKSLEEDDRIEFTVNPPRSVALIKKGNTELKDAVNEVLADYYESGDLAKVMEEAGLNSDAAYPDGR